MLTSSVEIRVFQKEDAEAVAALEAECFTMPWSAGAFVRLAEDAKSIGLTAFSENKIVGFCSVTDISGEGEINNVAVAPSFRERGIAGAMLKELLFLGEKAGIRDFTLEVRACNAPAIHIYEKLGFLSEGIRPRFYEKPVEDALIMWRRRPTITTSF